jgi:N6-L-threonylcarbamoyladenine synthase
VAQKILDLVASYQQAIIDTLVSQTRKAVRMEHPRSILLVGGVACNSLLRQTFTEVFEGAATGCHVYYPSPILTTDNAAMIAAAGTPKLLRGAERNLNLNAFANLPLC